MKTKFIIDDPNGHFHIEISVNKRQGVVMLEVSTECVALDAEQCLHDIGDKLLIYGASMKKLCGDQYIAYFILVPEFSMQSTLVNLEENFPDIVSNNCKSLFYE